MIIKFCKILFEYLPVSNIYIYSVNKLEVFVLKRNIDISTPTTFFIKVKMYIYKYFQFALRNNFTFDSINRLPMSYLQIMEEKILVMLCQVWQQFSKCVMHVCLHRYYYTKDCYYSLFFFSILTS